MIEELSGELMEQCINGLPWLRVRIEEGYAIITVTKFKKDENGSGGKLVDTMKTIRKDQDLDLFLGIKLNLGNPKQLIYILRVAKIISGSKFIYKDSAVYL